MSPNNDMEPSEVTLQSIRVMPSDPPTSFMPVLAPERLLCEHAALQTEPNTIHVWAFSTEGDAALIEQCRSVLADDERQRADRFVFARDRVHYTIAHGVLRHLLSRYCDVAPVSLRFETSLRGKPTLGTPPPGRGASPHFNLTHSADRALIGVSGRELGVDLEKIRANIEVLAISRHYFFGSERDAIEATPAAQCHDMFFRYWVAKEAVLKAQGIGLGFPLDRFRVDFLTDGTTARIESFDASVLRNDWRVRLLSCEDGWHAAVAARGEDWAVQVEPS